MFLYLLSLVAGNRVGHESSYRDDTERQNYWLVDWCGDVEIVMVKLDVPPVIGPWPQLACADRSRKHTEKASTVFASAFLTTLSVMQVCEPRSRP